MRHEMTDRICMVTGSSSGIGEVTALELARMGATVIMVCRDGERGEKVRSEIIRKAGNSRVELMICDLSSQKKIRALVLEFRSRHDKLHVLVNNAAAVPGTRTLTEDGMEMQLAVNHLAPFLLTHLLLDSLKAGAPSRIVNVSSGLHKAASVDFDNLQGEKNYRAMKIYGATKLLNVYFTIELARRLEDTGTTANCLSPGFTATRLGRDFPPFSRGMMSLLGKTKEKGARTVVYLASSPEVAEVTGKYFSDMKETPSSPLSHDGEISRRVWEISERWTGLVSG